MKNKSNSTIQQIRTALSISSVFVSSSLLLGACAPTAAVKPTSLPASLSIGETAPEDIAVGGTSAFVSNINDGSVLKLDLANGGAASSFIPAATDAYKSAWGLRVVTGKNWLLSIQNQPYDFNPAHALAGRVAAYDLTTGAKLKSWNLPAQMVGNSVDVDKAGNMYVGDIGPKPRIVKIDAISGEVTTWAASPQWVDGGFGIGGMVFNGTGFYAAHNNVLWYVGINADGSSVAPQAVKIEGNPVIFADGMAWTDDGIVYAENDVLVPGAHGTVFRVTFSGPTTATRTVIQTDLRDPSGVAAVNVNGKGYLLVNESQLGFAFGVDKGQASKPYRVLVVPR
jgi:hypothetical protein